MELIVHDNKTFEGIDYTAKRVSDREFQSCVFNKCDLSNSIFSKNKFLDCIFDGCNLSMMVLQGSILNNVKFSNCKIPGVNFSECNNLLFAVNFDGCILDYSSFMGKRMINTGFVKTSLKETTFSTANLAGSKFDRCELSGAVFNGTDLSSVNFESSYNYTIDPEINNIRKAIFSADGLPGLLTKHQIRIV